MTAQSATKATIPVGSDGWNPVVHIKQAVDTTRSIIPIGSASERTALPGTFPGGVLPVPTFISRTDQAYMVETWNGTAWMTKPHAEFTSATNTASSGTAWGMGTFTRDTGNSTDNAFVTISTTDQLQVRDAGLYSITMLIAFTTPISGISWLAVDGSYTTTMGGGLQTFAATLPNVKLAAGAIIKPLLSHGSGADRTFTGRVRVTRVA